MTVTKHILVLHTGGTISMTENSEGDIMPSQHNPLLGADSFVPADVELTTEEIFNLPSPHMTPERMLELVKRIRQAEKEGSDGLENLQSAIKTAASDDSRNKGTLVVMNDEIHTARFVTKTHTTNVATFRTPTFGPVGLVTKDGVRFFQELINQEICAIDHLVDKVFLIKAYAGMDGTLFDALPEDTHGLTIEALGAGNLPPTTLPAIQRLLDRNIPIVLVSRCFNGVAQAVYNYEGGGVQLKKMGIIFCQGLNGQKARIKLQVGLSDGKQGQDLADFVDNAVS